MGQVKSANLLISLVPVVFLMILLVSNIVIYQDDVVSGANQMALLIAGLLAAILGRFVLKVPYEIIEQQAIKSIGLATKAVVILLLVGALIGLWIAGGIVPTMTYYGLKIISPVVFLPVSCLVCAIISVGTGSSWSTSGTVGLALMGIGQVMGIPLGMVAGAVISGAYLGDKLSPLSDTTNLASAVSGVELFDHIGHMLTTTVPVFILALLCFAGLGFFYGPEIVSTGQIQQVMLLIEQHFHVGIYLLITPAIVLAMVAAKVPTLPSLALGAFCGALSALIFQRELLFALIEGELTMRSLYQTLLTISYDGFVMDTGNQFVDSLFSRGGMSNMLNTVWLILSAMIFGGAMEATGMLAAIAQVILRLVSGVGSLVGATVGSCIFFNMVASDQYLSLVVPGRMFRNAYQNFNYHPKNLSRALEDSGTVTSPLVPWSSCGAYNSGVLGVPTLHYLPFCFFNLLSPLIGVFVASMGQRLQEKKHLLGTKNTV